MKEEQEEKEEKEEEKGGIQVRNLV